MRQIFGATAALVISAYSTAQPAAPDTTATNGATPSDPLQDISSLAQVDFVMKGGKVVRKP